MLPAVSSLPAIWLTLLSMNGCSRNSIVFDSSSPTISVLYALLSLAWCAIFGQISKPRLEDEKEVTLRPQSSGIRIQIQLVLKQNELRRRRKSKIKRFLLLQSETEWAWMGGVEVVLAVTIWNRISSGWGGSCSCCYDLKQNELLGGWGGSYAYSYNQRQNEFGVGGVETVLDVTIWNRTRPRARAQSQQTRELISCRCCCCFIVEFGLRRTN